LQISDCRFQILQFELSYHKFLILSRLISILNSEFRIQNSEHSFFSGYHF
jgi:hypothetical protein